MLIFLDQDKLASNKDIHVLICFFHYMNKLQKPFEHESLLIDKKELRLTKKEKRLAQQSYVMEKRLNVSYSRPSYAAFYPKGQEGNARQIKIVSPPSQPIWYVSAEISMILVIILFVIFNFQNSNQFKMSQNSVFCLKQFLCLSLCLLQAVHYLHLSPCGQCEANDHHPSTHAAQGCWQGREPKSANHQQKQTRGVRS